MNVTLGYASHLHIQTQSMCRGVFGALMEACSGVRYKADCIFNMLVSRPWLLVSDG